LSRPLPPQTPTLLEGFWPLSNWRSNYAKGSLLTMMDIVDVEDLIRVLYCGPKNMKPLTTYMPFIDLNVGNFVFVKPYDPNLVLIWMGKVESDKLSRMKKVNILKW